MPEKRKKLLLLAKLFLTFLIFLLKLKFTNGLESVLDNKKSCSCRSLSKNLHKLLA
jgi:hypothetical protein